MKKFFSMAAALACLCLPALAQQELRDAIDAGDVASAQKMVKKGTVEEIYCGKLSPGDAVKVYEKIFKANPEASLEGCPEQFAYGYGAKACANPKAMGVCSEVTRILLKESTAGNASAMDALEAVIKSSLKNKAFAKPVKEQVDTTAWVACPKKGNDRTLCVERCKVQSDSLGDSLHRSLCDTRPEQFMETAVTVSRPSPLYELLRGGLVEGYWKSPMNVAEKFSKLMETNAKNLSIPDTSVVNLSYVERWVDSHKASGEALPGGQLFRFCTAWQVQVDSLLLEKAVETRCPVFETFVDPRDNKSYKVKEIAGARWFVQNLDYASEEGSACYDREEENCKVYGRQYNHETAIMVCPEGTHLATEEEWNAVEALAGGAGEAAVKLLSTGTDEFAFTAMLGGHTNKNGFSVTAGEGAYFWMEAPADEGRSYARSMFSSDRDVSRIPVDNGFMMSVRCVVDGSVSSETSNGSLAEE